MKAIRHTGIVITNLKKSLHFYRDLLGLKIVRQMNEAGNYIDNMLALDKVRVTTVKMAADDGNLVELLLFKSHPRKRETVSEICSVGCTHVAFTVDNLDQLFRRLTKSGIVFNAPPQYSADGKVKVTFCKDPDGTLLELVEIL